MARLAPAYPVRSARLALRPLGQADVATLVSYRSLPDVCRYVPFEPMTARDVSSRLQGAWSRTTVEEEGDGLILGVELGKTGELVGDVMLHWVSEAHRCAELGYVFHPAHGGNGFATEAGHAVLHLAFDGLGVHRVIARVDARNVASIHVLERLGMRREAYLVQNEWFKGEWTDEIDFALLEEEWRSTRLGGCPGCDRADAGRRTLPSRPTGGTS